MGQRYRLLGHWTESDLPGPVSINLIHWVEVEDTKTGATAKASGWSKRDAMEKAIGHLGGAG